MRRQFIETAQAFVWVSSGFMLMGIFGGIEGGMIAEWKLLPAILLLAIIDGAMLMFSAGKEKKNAKRND